MRLDFLDKQVCILRGYVASKTIDDHPVSVNVVIHAAFHRLLAISFLDGVAFWIYGFRIIVYRGGASAFKFFFTGN
jgi:hypothetical protein